MDNEEFIKSLQNIVDEKYEEDGAVDVVMDMQICLNKLRNKYNINETNEEFVQ